MSGETIDGIALAITDGVAHVTFDRPEARNAMSFAMYLRLGAICEQLESGAPLHAIIFRGAGGAFVAGTDIGEFTAFGDGTDSGTDGVKYEHMIEGAIARLEALPAPTVAVVDGPAIGGGLVIAAACDLRLVTPASRFGVPIARTVGNCLSAANIARLVRAFGDGPARQMLLLSKLFDGETVHRLGFSVACAEADQLEAELERVIATLSAAAPLTISACRELFSRITPSVPDDSDVIERVYGSEDFREGVRAFLEKRRPEWSGS